MKYPLIILAAGLFCSASWAAPVEGVKIPVGSQTSANKITLPVTGQTKDHVRKTFGEPIALSTAKGKPPIEHWDYAEFTVYFENNHVIHSVIKPILKKNEEIIIETVDEMPEEVLKQK